MMHNDPDFLDYLAGLDTETSLSTKKEIDVTAAAALKKIGLKRKLSGKRKAGRVLLIAAAIAAGAVVSAAAAGVNIGDMFRGCFTAFNPTSNHSESTDLTEGQLEVLNKTGKAINQSVTCNGTTITIKAAAGDKHKALFLMEINAPSGKILTDGHFSDIRFSECSFNLPGAETEQKGWSGGGGAVPKQSSNNKIVYLWDIQSSELDLQGQEVKLVIKDIMDYKNRVTAAGTWSFDFRMDYKGSKTKEIKINKTVHYLSTHKSNKNTTIQCTAGTVKLSAMSAAIDFTGENLFDEDRIQQVPNCVIIHRRNGKDLFLLHGNGDGNSKELTVSYPANEPIDLDSISSITIGDLTVPVS